MESAHLLRSPRNAQRLLPALRKASAGAKLESLRAAAKKGLDQTGRGEGLEFWLYGRLTNREESLG